MNMFSEYLLPLTVALIMTAMGLALRPADFAAVLRAPSAVAVGLGCQILLLPAIGFVVASAWPMDPALAVGFMIIAACPGGPMSNLLTHLAHGDTALSISLTAVMSLIGIVTLPLIVSLSLPHFLGAAAPDISVAGTMFGVSVMTLVPVALGMAIRAVAPQFARALEPKARLGAAALFALLLVAAVAIEWDRVTAHLPALGPPVLLVNLLAMTGAFLIAKATANPPGRVVALTIECGIQNGSLAMFVAATLLGSEMMMLPGASYGLLMFPTALAFIAFVLRAERRHAAMRTAP